MSIYVAGILLAMGFDFFVDGKEEDTFKIAIKHLIFWLTSWFAVGIMLASMYNKIKRLEDKKEQ